MNQLRQFLRAKRWVNKPPSMARIKAIAGIIALCIVLFAFERILGWPDFLTLEHVGRAKLPNF